ncbi:hypothetical protein [Simiduia agarivorans]|uniref:Uncharacterized protein n=1 Tax=Simiduia agarivorans (strain DSM 21679 / JCM 13881 / BCRC 17597 / SA1) TaxID=1117647 RepID=K4KMG2_SIMAS|nr:hypothetical protein [Simiduia agarivorans]AFV00192.2 hypothetical protein M5M_15295 [Simiduia agarivorans SA1 = DSM 21679]
MNLSISLIAQAIAAWMLVSTILIWFVARAKTNAPVMHAFSGFFLAIIPPLSLIYLLVLLLKKDEKEESFS